jgi:hypothetical protein
MTVKEILQSRMEIFSRRRRGLINAALRYRLGVLAAGSGIFCVLALGGRLPNAFVNVALFLAVGVVLLVRLAKYLRRKERFRSHLDEAFRMEDLAAAADNNLNSRLISALDFAEYEPPSSLMQVVIDRAQNDIGLDFEHRLDRSARNRFRKRFATVLAAFVILGLTPWFGFGGVAANFRASLFAVAEYLFPVVYEISPPGGQRHVHRVGEEVDVQIRFTGRAFGRVTLVETVGEETVEHPLTVNESGTATHRLKGLVEAEHHMRFEFGERVTDEMLVVFANPPALENMQTELVYPPYTRMLPRSLEGVQQRLFALKGTRITLGFTFSKELKRATFSWDDGTELTLDVTGRFASTSFVHSQSRRASLQVVDKDDFSLEYPFYIDFELQMDEAPQVFLPRSLKKEMAVLAEGLKLFGFGVRMQDDYGVSRCVLQWKKATISNPSGVTAKGEVERLISPPRRKAVVSFQKIFENLAAEPGDRISFSVRVYDNRMPKRQEATSQSKALFVYQQGLEDLAIASLHFGGGSIVRTRMPKSRRASSVKEPMAMKTREKVWNEYEAKIDTTTKAPVIPGDYAQAVKDYLRLISTAVREMPEDDGAGE